MKAAGGALLKAATGLLPSLGPALQPMPRFMGAGPVANGNLLRSGHGAAA